MACDLFVHNRQLYKAMHKSKSHVSNTTQPVAIIYTLEHVYHGGKSKFLTVSSLEELHQLLHSFFF